MHKTQDEWIEEYTKRGAFWMHDGNPKRPHVRLTKGGHSNGFFNSELVMEDPTLLNEACEDLVELFIEAGYNPDMVDRVVGPAMGAITLSNDIARNMSNQLSMKRMFRPCLRSYAEKGVEAGVVSEGEVMVFKKTRVCENERVLLCEDVITTGGSLKLAADAVAKEGGIMPHVVLSLVNRSGKSHINGRRIISLVDKHMPVWKPGECPLCEQGSLPLYPPKETKNWELLNADY